MLPRKVTSILLQHLASDILDTPAGEVQGAVRLKRGALGYTRLDNASSQTLHVWQMIRFNSNNTIFNFTDYRAVFLTS